MAKRQGIAGWHGMRKDELVRALARAAQARRAKRRASAAKSPDGRSNGSKKASSDSRTNRRRKPAVTAPKPPAAKATAGAARKAEAAKPRSPRAASRIQIVSAERERLKDLSSTANGKPGRGTAKGERRVGVRQPPRKDRLVLLVRDPYWLHACWEIRRQSVERVRAAMAERWHAARPILRLIEVDAGPTTSAAERVVREIQVHGGVSNWYLPVSEPPKSFRVDIGYQTANGRFHALARSNPVTTPSPGNADALDENWSDVAKDYDKVFSLSGGYTRQLASGDLKDLFEERLRRPMGSSLVTKYGVGGNRKAAFSFDVDAELIIYGQTKPNAHVTLAGEPVRLRPDGSFTVRKTLPNRRQVLPVVAGSGDGLEQRTIILAIERNTKVMEPLIRDPSQA